MDKVQEIGIWPSVVIVLALSAAVRFLLKVSFAEESTKYIQSLTLVSRLLIMPSSVNCRRFQDRSQQDSCLRISCLH